MKAQKGMNGRRVPALFLTGRSWTGATIAEVAQQVRAAGAKSGVYVFEDGDGCALYVGRSLYKLAGRIGFSLGSSSAVPCPGPARLPWHRTRAVTGDAGGCS